MKWISVKEQEPEYFKQVLVLISLNKLKLKLDTTFNGYLVRGACFNGVLRSDDDGFMSKQGVFKVQDESCGLLCDLLTEGITHWAPLPIFPED